MAEPIAPRDLLAGFTALWSDVVPPNAPAEQALADLETLAAGFRELRGRLRFEDEPSDFEAALRATRDPAA